MIPADPANYKRELSELLPGASVEVAVLEGVVVDPDAPFSMEVEMAWMAGPIAVKAPTAEGALTLMLQALAEARERAPRASFTWPPGLVEQ